MVVAMTRAKVMVVVVVVVVVRRRRRKRRQRRMRGRIEVLEVQRENDWMGARGVCFRLALRCKGKVKVTSLTPATPLEHWGPLAWCTI